MNRAIVPAVCLALSCVAPKRSAARATPPRDAAIQLELAVPGVEPLRSPTVEGRVAGRRVRMLLDTGAGVSVIAGWLARAIDLEVEQVQGDVRDSLGQKLSVQLARRARVDIDGWGAIAGTQ